MFVQLGFKNLHMISLQHEKVVNLGTFLILLMTSFLCISMCFQRFLLIVDCLWVINFLFGSVVNGHGQRYAFMYTMSFMAGQFQWEWVVSSGCRFMHHYIAYFHEVDPTTCTRHWLVPQHVVSTVGACSVLIVLIVLRSVAWRIDKIAKFDGKNWHVRWHTPIHKYIGSRFPCPSCSPSFHSDCIILCVFG